MPKVAGSGAIFHEFTTATAAKSALQRPSAGPSCWWLPALAAALSALRKAQSQAHSRADSVDRRASGVPHGGLRILHSPRPHLRDQIVSFEPPGLYYRSPDAGEIQCKPRQAKKRFGPVQALESGSFHGRFCRRESRWGLSSPRKQPDFTLSLLNADERSVVHRVLCSPQKQPAFSLCLPLSHTLSHTRSLSLGV